MRGPYKLHPDPRIRALWDKVESLRKERLDITETIYLCGQDVIELTEVQIRALYARDKAVVSLIRGYTLKIERLEAAPAS